MWCGRGKARTTSTGRPLSPSSLSTIPRTLGEGLLLPRTYLHDQADDTEGQQAMLVQQAGLQRNREWVGLADQTVNTACRGAHMICQQHRCQHREVRLSHCSSRVRHQEMGGQVGKPPGGGGGHKAVEGVETERQGGGSWCST